MGTRSLSLLAAIWLLLGSGLVLTANAIDGGDGWPVLGAVVVGAVGGVELLALLWFRQMPVAPGDDAHYRSTVLVKLSAAAGIALVAFALAVIVGPWWLAGLGVALSLVGLALAWPSASDRERHELLYLV